VTVADVVDPREFMEEALGADRSNRSLRTMTSSNPTAHRRALLSRRLRQGAAAESGFTLVELIIVVQIIGIVMAMAVPSILGYKQRANKRAASSDVRTAIPVAELYYGDASLGKLSYKNMTVTALQTMSPGVKLDAVVVSTDFTTYCAQRTVGGFKSIAVRGLRPAAGGAVQENVSSDCPAAGSL
jgi:prepilin-type N-terminal cleavage/methylation domain-containing protein